MKRNTPRPMDEDQLVAMLRREEMDATSFYTSELAQAQTDAMDAYHGKLRGDEQLPNRSKVVTGDIRDTINWIMPALMRCFSPGEDFLTVDDNELDDDDPTLEDAKNYLRHVFFKDNPGEFNIHDFAFDGLLQKAGVFRCYWQDPDPEPPKILEGVTLDQLAKIVQDPEYTILAQSEDGIEPEDGEDEPGTAVVPFDPSQAPDQPEPTFTLKVQRQRKYGHACVECIPPEEFRVSRRARSLRNSRAHTMADYHAWQHDEFLADLVRLHPDRAHEIDPDGNAQSKPSDITDTDGDMRVLSRFPDEPSSGQRATYNEDNRHKCVVLIEYIRVDYDGDGIVELRRVKRVGNVVLENDIVDESEFVLWSPLRVAHRLIGQSLAETILDIQRIRTQLMRAGLDSIALASKPRIAINKAAYAHDPSLLDRFLDHEIGDVLDVSGNPGDMIMPITTPDVSPTCFNAIEFMDQRSEEASGVTRAATGIRPSEQHDTKGGIDLLQAAANARVEQVARWLGYGIEECFGKLLRTLVRHQDHARVVKINGRKLNVDPRRWSDEMTVSVHVGGAQSRERQLMMLNTILDKQTFALKELGLANPLVKIQHVGNTLKRMIACMGFKNPKDFIDDIPPDWQPPEQPQEDPKVIEAKGKMQIEQQKLQAQQQLQAAELQAKQQMAAAQAQIDQQTAAVKSQADAEAQAQKIAMEERMALSRLEMEERLAMARLAQEREMAEIKMAQERDLAREAMAYKQSLPDEKDDSFRPGGRLDA